MKQSVYIVIPTIRSLAFLKDWKDAFNKTHLVIIEDHKTQEIESPTGGFQSIHHYTWEDSKKNFGKNEWIFSRRNAGIRSYGFWKAYTLGADVIITLDDDCYPIDRDLVSQHLENLNTKAPDGWFPTFPDRRFVYTRGFPYGIRNKRRVVVSHGLWTHHIDLDAKTQIHHPNVNLPPYPPILQFIPQGLYFPMCSMNLAFVRSVTPLMYFPLMGKDPFGNAWGYDRFDDIWAGIFAKKIIDHLGFAVVNGSPFVEHRKASDTAKNLIKEQKGIATNETLWKAIDEVQLTKKTSADCYGELAINIKFPDNPYFDSLRKAMILWAKLF